jgi:hypothetical protein
MSELMNSGEIRRRIRARLVFICGDNGCAICNPWGRRVNSTWRCLMCNHVFNTLARAHIITASCGCSGVGYECAVGIPTSLGVVICNGCEFDPNTNDCWRCRWGKTAE